MTEIHITDSTQFEEDIVADTTLRPSKFDDFVGQDSLVENLKLYVLSFFANHISDYIARV